LEPPDLSTAFDRLVVEGPRHGPVLLDRLPPPDVTGSVTVRVPRKCELLVVTEATRGLTQSLYSQDDREMRRPAHRLEDVAAGTVQIPAGEWVLALSQKGSAPDLHLLSAAPGGKRAVTHRPRAGWSLVASCHEAQTGRPLPGAWVRLRDPESPKEQPFTASVKTNEKGLAVFSGVSHPFGAVRVESVGFVSGEAGGITAAAGTLAVRSVDVVKYGGLALSVVIDDAPAAGARCRLLEPAREKKRDLTLAAVWEGVTGSDGRAVGGKIPPGRFLLRVFPRPGLSTLHEETVSIQSAKTEDVEIRLSSIRLEGNVKRGSEPEPQATIASVPFIGSGPADDEGLSKASSDRDGHYELELWRAGRYYVSVETAGVTADARFIDVPSKGATADFQLNNGRLSGHIVDVNGKGIADAWVSMKWIRSDSTSELRERNYPTYSDPEGRFEFSFSGTGHARLIAGKPGFRRTEPQELDIGPDVDPPEMTFVLDRGDTAAGRVILPPGMPAAGVSVGAFDPVTSQGLDTAVTDADGRFVVRRAPGGATGIVLTGPLCPLGLRQISRDDDEAVLQCAGGFGSIALTLRDDAGKPLSGEAVTLKLGSFIFPPDVLPRHLARLGLSALTDGSGRVDLVALEPGHWDVFLSRGSSRETIVGGLPYGHLMSLDLSSGTTEEEVVSVRIEGKLTP
jgi:hypothetical protein